jgi:hypothetical protein
MTSLSYELALYQDQQCEYDELERFYCQVWSHGGSMACASPPGSSIGSYKGPNFYTTIFAAN